MTARAALALRWAAALAVMAAAAMVEVPVAHAQRGRIAPEADSAVRAKSVARAGRHLVAAAHPLAAEAGREILRAGGSAVDAAIAVQLVLGLVEPQSSGLGGGAFMLHWHQANQKVVAYDGRETAPAAVTGDRFQVDGRPMAFRAAMRSGLSVGVPGVLAMLAAAHREHGRLAWARLFEPAVRLAEQGFAISPRLHVLLSRDAPATFSPAARQHYFLPDGRPRALGSTLANPQLAATLRAVASGGVEEFYRGTIAQSMVAAVQGASRPGDLTLADLAGYVPKVREAVCDRYRGFRICGMGPPSSGAHTVLQTLRIFEQLTPGPVTSAVLATDSLHLIAEASKLAFADRNRYLADPDFVDMPSGLLDAGYLAARARLIEPGRVLVRPPAGSPPGRRAALGADATLEAAGTSHLSVVDGWGNAVAMTTTIEGAFGSGLWAAGFLLNNQLTDFSFLPADAAGRPIANRIESGKRPRSSMAPTLVFAPDGQLFAVIGSPGGSRIIPYVVKALVALIDWKLDAQAAAALLNFGSRGEGFEIEWPPPGRPGATGVGMASSPWVWHALKMMARGHMVRPDVMTSGLHIIVRRGDGLEGGADPRREGVALGD